MCASDDRRDHARDDDRRKRARSKIAQNHLACEKDAADRRVKRRRNAGRSAACHERSQNLRRRVHELAQHRTDGRSNLHDRAFASAASAETDTGCRRYALDGDYARTHDAALQRDRGHHFRHAVAFSFARETIHNERRDHTARDQHWHDSRGSERVQRRRKMTEC